MVKDGHQYLSNRGIKWPYPQMGGFSVHSGHVWSYMTMAIAHNEHMAIYWLATSLFKVLISYESFVHLWTQDMWTCFEHWHSVIPNPTLLLIFKSPANSPGFTVGCGQANLAEGGANHAVPRVFATWSQQGRRSLSRALRDLLPARIGGWTRAAIRSHKLLRSCYWDVVKPELVGVSSPCFHMFPYLSICFHMFPDLESATWRFASFCGSNY